MPQDIEGARNLAMRGRREGRHGFAFEKWAVSPLAGEQARNTGDGGIDGIVPFGKKPMAVVSVNAGENVGVAMIRDLPGAMERTGAEIGTFLTLTPPEGGMQAEAAAAGQHEEPGFAHVPRIRIARGSQAMAPRDRAAQIPARLGSVQKVAPKRTPQAQERLPQRPGGRSVSEPRRHAADGVEAGGVGGVGAQEPVAGVGQAVEEQRAAQRIVARARRDPRAQRVGLELGRLAEAARAHQRAGAGELLRFGPPQSRRARQHRAERAAGLRGRVAPVDVPRDVVRRLVAQHEGQLVSIARVRDQGDREADDRIALPVARLERVGGQAGAVVHHDPEVAVRAPRRPLAADLLGHRLHPPDDGGEVRPRLAARDAVGHRRRGHLDARRGPPTRRRRRQRRAGRGQRRRDQRERAEAGAARPGEGSAGGGGGWARGHARLHGDRSTATLGAGPPEASRCRRDNSIYLPRMTGPPRPLEVIYNAECPICRAEVDGHAARARRQGLPVRFTPIAEADLAAHGLTEDDAARRLHAVRGGTLLKGLDANRAMWAAMPGWRWLARLTGTRPVRPLAAALYDRALAPALHALHRRRTRRRSRSRA